MIVTGIPNVHQSSYIAHDAQDIDIEASTYVAQEVKDWIERKEVDISDFFLQFSQAYLKEGETTGVGRIDLFRKASLNKLENALQKRIKELVSEGVSFGFALIIQPAHEADGLIPTFRGEVVCLLKDDVTGGYTKIKTGLKDIEDKTYIKKCEF